MPLRDGTSSYMFCLHMHKCGSFCASTVDEKPDKGLLENEQKSKHQRELLRVCYNQTQERWSAACTASAFQGDNYEQLETMNSLTPGTLYFYTLCQLRCIHKCNHLNSLSSSTQTNRTTLWLQNCKWPAPKSSMWL